MTTFGYTACVICRVGNAHLIRLVRVMIQDENPLFLVLYKRIFECFDVCVAPPGLENVLQ